MPPKYKRTDQNDASSSERRNLLSPNSDEEDFFVSGDQPGSSKSDGKTQRLQDQVNDVVSVMQDNMGKVLDRGDKLSDLEATSERLSVSASAFKTGARNVRTTMWWKECKMKIVLIVVLLVALSIIIIPIVVKYK